jgi:hypothetical protein
MSARRKRERKQTASGFFARPLRQRRLIDEIEFAVALGLVREVMPSVGYVHQRQPCSGVGRDLPDVQAVGGMAPVVC